MADTTTEDPKAKNDAAAAPEGEAAAPEPEGVDAGSDAGTDDEKTDEQIWSEFETAEAKADKDAGDTPEPEPEPEPEKPADTETDAAGETPPATEPPKTEDKTKGSKDAAADQAAATDADEIWANAPPELKAAHEAALKRIREGHRRNVKGYENAIADLRGQIDTKPEGADADAPKPQLTLKSPVWQDFETTYPDVAGPVREVLEGIVADAASVRKELGTVSKEHRVEALKGEERKLTESHPDWEEVIEATTFRDWLADQPGFIHEMAIRNSDAIRDAEEAGHLLDLYNKRTTDAGGRDGQSNPSPDGGDGQKPAANPKHDAKRQAQMESAASPASGGGPSARAHTGPPDTDDPQKLWDYFEAEDRKKGEAA